MARELGQSVKEGRELGRRKARELDQREVRELGQRKGIWLRNHCRVKGKERNLTKEVGQRKVKEFGLGNRPEEGN